jgi:Beta-propeller repeat
VQIVTRGLSAKTSCVGHSNYLFGSNSAAWITDVEQYARVRYAKVYPGIDLVFHGNQSCLEHDFVLHPGADAEQIGLVFSGVHQTALGASGDLVLRAGDGEVRLQSPRAYQIVGGQEVEVSARYVVTANRAHLSVGSYDRRRTLIIDPVVVYSTFLGGLSGAINFATQFASAVATDEAGNLYVTGETRSGNFPVTPGALQTTANQNTFAFVSKINPSGTALVYSTYISGIAPSFSDEIFPLHMGLAVDSSGNVFLGGRAAPAYQSRLARIPFSRIRTTSQCSN